MSLWKLFAADIIDNYVIRGCVLIEKISHRVTCRENAYLCGVSTCIQVLSWSDQSTFFLSALFAVFHLCRKIFPTWLVPRLHTHIEYPSTHQVLPLYFWLVHFFSIRTVCELFSDTSLGMSVFLARNWCSNLLVHFLLTPYRVIRLSDFRTRSASCSNCVKQKSPGRVERRHWFFQGVHVHLRNSNM